MAPLLPPGKADSSGGSSRGGGGRPAKPGAIKRILSRAYTARLQPTLEAANWEQDTDLESGAEKKVSFQ